MLIVELNDLVDAKFHQQVWDECMLNDWQFGHHSSGGESVQSFWKMDLSHSDICDQLWALAKPKCENLVNHPLQVIRQYANGHT